MSSHFFARWGGTLRSWIDRLASSRRAPVDAPAARRTGVEGKPPDAGAAMDTMRSLEELKADLARLRASSKERHAAVPVRRQQSFDDEVFANFVAPATAAPDKRGSEDYPRAVYVPRHTSKPTPTK